MWCCRAEANGKNEAPQRKQEAQLTILPLQHSKVPILTNTNSCTSQSDKMHILSRLHGTRETHAKR